MPETVLMVVTAATSLPARDGDRLPTGFWASEVLDPYELLTGAGHDVVIATPGGRPPSADERSLDDPGLGERLRSVEGLAEPRALSEVEDVAPLAAILLPGGHGPMGDLYGDPHLGRILRAAVTSGTPVCAICHGPAGLLSALQGGDGWWPFSGRRMTAFSDAEEQAAGLRDRLEWSLEQVLRDTGAKLAFADEPFAEHVVVDDRLVTGQNPASARPATETLLRMITDR